MKFAQLALGTAAERPIEFPVLVGDDAITVKSAVRPITGTEEAEAIAFATAYAKEHKSDATDSGDPLWDLGYMVKVVQIACVDPDSPKDTREPTFATTGEILRHLPRQTIAFLFECQQGWQDECSPTVRNISAGDLIGKVQELAEAENDLPFLRLSPGLRWICVRSMARMLLSSQEDKSPGFSPSASSGESLRNEPEPRDEPSESEKKAT